MTRRVTRTAAAGTASPRTASPRTASSRTASSRTTSSRTTSRVPTLRLERGLLREGHRLVAGMDEVGRGALAGPVTVGVVVVHQSTRTAPAGVKDSKLLAPAVREALVPKLRRWAHAYAVGHAEPEEIDRYGIIAALRLAGRRALAQLPEVPALVLLDGSHDWLTLRPPAPSRAVPAPADGLFDLPTEAVEPSVGQSVEPSVGSSVGPSVGPSLREVAPLVPLAADPQVRTLVKADLRCAAVAAASVLAKVERDAIMVERSARFPQYGWHENKGYSAPEHGAALRSHGPCDQHRRTWSLPQPTLDLDALDLDGVDALDAAR